MLLLPRHLLHILQILLRHLLRWDLDDHAVDLVQPQLPVGKAKERSVDAELAGAIVPLAQRFRRGTACRRALILRQYGFDE